MFRGCTRPPMFMGVPYVPFFMGAGGCFMLAIYFNFYYLFLIPPVIFTMRMMAKRDEMIFRLLGLRLQFRAKMRNLQQNEGMWVFTPNSYRGHREKP
jgi:type IV secretion system protein VirB3